jgi:hypothetical protein
MSRPSRTHLPLAAAALLIALLPLTAPAPARAQTLKPWLPPSRDSLLALATEARVSFRANRGDSVTGPNFHGYDVVGRMALRLVRSLGRANLVQVHAVEAVLDSLGLDTSAAIDPAHPTFALIMVHNPFQPGAPSVGFLYWYRDTELRWQGTVYQGGREPQMRVWWTGLENSPYQVGVLDVARGGNDLRRFTLLSLTQGGASWMPVQYEGNGPDFTGARDVGFADLNRDGTPELIAWTQATPESLFESCSGCPPLLTEQIWVLRGGRFAIDDSRIVPSPWSTFLVFIRLLRDNNRAGAARLLEDPSRIDAAIRAGWAGGKSKGLWRVEYGEPDQAWPRWLAIRFHGTPARPLYIVHFSQKDLRWVIHDWVVPQPVAPGGAAPDSSRRSAPAGAAPRGGKP